MKKETWVVLSKDQLLQSASQELQRGEKIYLSAYDLPSKLHIVSDSNNMAINFIYADSESGKWFPVTDAIAIRLGEYSNKVLSIKVLKRALELGAVRNKVKHAPLHCAATGSEKELLQRETIDAVLDQNSQAIQDMALT